jgi:16S rRNA (guanine527-N7)-methyltransferase
MNSNPDAAQVAAAAKQLGRTLSDEQARVLSVYLNLLVRWNTRMNLVGPSTWPEILDTLIQDSWHLSDLLHTVEPQPGQILDMGAGAGLPGIPLRVFWQSGEYCLVESRQKRALFMEQAVVRMKLPRTTVICARMEALPPARRTANLIVSRAFMPWRKLLVAVKNCLAPQGRVLVMSNEASDTIVEGYALEQVRDYTVAGKKRFFRLFVLGGHDF